MVSSSTTSQTAEEQNAGGDGIVQDTNISRTEDYDVMEDIPLSEYNTVNELKQQVDEEEQEENESENENGKNSSARHLMDIFGISGRDKGSIGLKI